MPKISVITPMHRGVDNLSHLLNDFNNQIYKDFELVIVYDGEPPKEVTEYIKSKNYSWVKFFQIEKDSGDMKIAPGTRPRNHGVQVSTGNYVVFCDDDDRYKDTYLKSLITDMSIGSVNIVQMSCSESRMYKNGDPKTIHLIPEVGLPSFPIVCHVGTPCFIVPRQWALDYPWQNEPEHDFRFIKKICEVYKPTIRLSSGMQVDVDGLVIQNMHSWVSIPPFFRDNDF